MQPKFEDSPGVVVKRRKHDFKAQWQASPAAVRLGWKPTAVKLWDGIEPTEHDRVWVSDRAHALQNEMNVWLRGGLPQVSSFDGTLKSLSDCYQTDPDSPYRTKRYVTRCYYDRLCRRIEADHGDVAIREIKGRMLRRWHEDWMQSGVSMAHALIGQLRALVSFGASILDDQDCRDLRPTLSEMKFKMGRPQREELTAEHATAIRAKAHAMGKHSIALAQAFQFEMMIRQKDVIGEWVPLSEPEPSDVIDGNRKWLRGLRWNEIDQGLIVRHVTSKRDKPIAVDLKLAPMVLEELQHAFGSTERAALPSSGPVIVCETTELPWDSANFRPHWRAVADAAGIPKSVKNMHSRHGAITEAIEAGANIDHVRKAATHSNRSTTEGYIRGDERMASAVAIARLEKRNRK